MVFWIVAALVALTVTATLVVILLRGGRATGEAETSDVQVYRDQLAEIDRDLARGVIGAEDAERVRLEVSRRILAADAAAQKAARAGRAGRMPAMLTAGFVGLVLVGGSLGLYWQLGAPGYEDLGLERRYALAEEFRAARPSQAEAEAAADPAPEPEGLSEDYKALVEELRTTVAARPDDVQGHQLLARHEAASGNYIAAHQAQARVLELMGDAATARDYSDYADMLILAADGFISPEAEAALKSALDRDPRNGIAGYYWGLMMAQTGRPDRAFAIWDKLMMTSPPGAPWVPPIRSQIELVARQAGIPFTLPPTFPDRQDGPRGPSAEDIEAAGDMSAEDRQAMIRSMVEGLAERLATEGGPPAEWGRLIGALAVLNETERARAVLAEARAAFDGDPEAVAEINAAAARAGLDG